MLESGLPTNPLEWSKFEASCLTTGLFMLLPMPTHETTADDNKSIRLWRKVLDLGLVDFLRGPMGNVLPEPDPSMGEQELTKARVKYQNSLRDSRKIYRDVCLWLYGKKTVSQTLESLSGEEERETQGDFISVCDLAYLDPETVKNAYLKLFMLKQECV